MTKIKKLYYIYPQKHLKKDNITTYSLKNKNCINWLSNEFSALLKQKGFETIVFDRRKKRYCGNIKLFCENIRNLGIKC